MMDSISSILLVPPGSDLPITTSLDTTHIAYRTQVGFRLAASLVLLKVVESLCALPTTTITASVVPSSLYN
jgi:TctA family transporter